MGSKLAQYKEKANEEFWSKTFINYNIEEKVEQVKKSRLLSIIKSKINKKDKTLEVGCGMGKLSIALLKEGYDLIGVDYSKELIIKIKKEMPEFKENFRFMDGRDLKFKDKTFDALISPGVIEHFHEEDQNKMLSELHRVLKDDGKLVCIVPYLNLVKKIKFNKLQKRYDKLRDNGIEFYQYVYSKNEIKKVLKSNGFHVTQINLLGLHDTSIMKRKIIPKFMQNNNFLLKIFGTTICLTCNKIN